MLWAGRILTALPVLILLASAGAKFAAPPGFEDGFKHMGMPLDLRIPLGILEIACTLIYLFPKTSVLGAILLTGYMGGAICTHVRVGDPFIVQLLIGMALWGGLYCRDARVRALIPLKA